MELNVLDEAWMTPITPMQALALRALGKTPPDSLELRREKSSHDERLGEVSQAGVAVLSPFPISGDTCS